MSRKKHATSVRDMLAYLSAHKFMTRLPNAEEFRMKEPVDPLRLDDLTRETDGAEDNQNV